MSTPIRSLLSPAAPDFLANADVMRSLTDEVRDLHDQVLAGGGTQYVERHRSRGKMMVRERLEALVDPGTPVLELCPLAGLHTPDPVGGGVVVALAEISRTQCLVIGNDPTVRGGTTSPTTIRKLLRAMDVAEINRLPVVLLVESGGADLPRQADVFVPGGEQFRRLTQLSAQGIPTICVVFGSSTAGGAYLPGMSDYTIMVEGRARVFLGGPPLVKMAIGEEADEEELGGARMHARVSGLCDYLAGDEIEAIRMARGVVAHLHWERLGPAPCEPADDPLYPADELLGIASVDVRVPFDIREILARVVDGSRFEEFKESYGPQLVCGWASIGGYPIGVVANNGILFSPEAQKGAQFIQLCNRIDAPILFVQNITGFMVGTRYEQGGIIKDGAKLINAVSNSAVPHLTLMVGASYGAGNYAMAGRAYDPRFVFTWPNHRIAVMGPKQLAGVLSIVRRNAAEAAGRPFDEAADEELRQATENQIEEESTAQYATGRLWDDGIIDPRQTRTVLAIALAAVHSAPVRGTARFGVVQALMATGSAPDRITRLLVADRGEIARRVILGAHNAGCEAVAVYAADDQDSPHVGEADAAVLLHGASLSETYLNAAALVDAARQSGADALHPGYGFLSENPVLPEACEDAGIVWVGPSAEAMRVMGHKARAKEVVAAAGVPVLPSVVVPPDATAKSLTEAAAAVGYPLLVKASAGGGGRGMRRVSDGGELADAVASAQREAAATFGSNEVFLERYLGAPRHVEVQVLGDSHGTVLHLFDRECSVQRRHQKLVEEAPAVAVPLDTRRQMWDAAVAAAAAVGYAGAGTVEFLVDASGFFFLEMNTRLQVEHGVTELVTGVDLVGLQLTVAAGRPLPMTQPEIAATGHAVEVRLCAERPSAEDYRPTPGTVAHVRWPAGAGLRTDRAIESGSVVSPAYDSLVAKLMAHGDDRAGAVARLGRALRTLELDGPETNRELLAAVLADGDFRRGDVDIHYLENRPDLRDAQHSDEVRRLHAAAVAFCLLEERASRSLVPVRAPGWRNVGDALHGDVLSDTAGTVEVRVPAPDQPASVVVDGRWHEVATARVRGATVDLTACSDGVRRRYLVRHTAHSAFVNGPEGQTTFALRSEDDADERGGVAGECRAPLPGAITKILVAVGDLVAEGEGLVVLEAMKMEHTLRAHGAGVVSEVLASAGQQVDVGDLLVSVEPAGPV